MNAAMNMNGRSYYLLQIGRWPGLFDVAPDTFGGATVFNGLRRFIGQTQLFGGLRALANAVQGLSVQDHLSMRSRSIGRFVPQWQAHRGVQAGDTTECISVIQADVTAQCLHNLQTDRQPQTRAGAGLTG